MVAYGFLLLATLLVISTEMVTGAPKALKEENFEKSLAQFLAEDKQFQNLLEEGSLLAENAGLRRQKRQSEVEGMGVDDLQDDGNSGAEQPGFFDRAAKFVMELLQRFLKWVNAPDN